MLGALTEKDHHMLNRVDPKPSPTRTMRRNLNSTLVYLHRFYSPIGTLLAVSDSDHLHAVEFGDYETRLRTLLKRRLGAAALIEGEDPLGVESAFRRYFKGDLLALDGVPVAFTGTPFQSQIWLSLQEIPAGKTVTYAALAALVGNNGAARAVGFAVGQNPIAVVVPCHRVLGTSGALTGYAGGIARKRWLLNHEQTFSATEHRRH